MPLLTALIVALQVSAAPPIDATRLAISPARQVVQFDTSKIKGEPWRLAWSDDGKQLYLQSIERDKYNRPIGSHHYVLTLDNGKLVSEDGEPTWASAYWNWKSGQAAPGAPGERITVEQRSETVSATASPMGGDLARGGVNVTGTSMADAANAAYQSQVVNVFALRYHGELLGEWRNEAVVPGLTFGWAPANHVALAYADKRGRLTIVDGHGGRQVVPLVEDAMLPAWSGDARHLAFLQRNDKKHYAIDIVDIGEQ